MRKTLSLVLALAMIFQLLPVSVFAEGYKAVESDTIEDLTYYTASFQANGKVVENRAVAAGTALGDLPAANGSTPLFGWLDRATNTYAQPGTVLTGDATYEAVFSYMGNLKGSASKNGITMTVLAPEGALPENVQFRSLTVSDTEVEAAVGGLDAANVAAIDLSFFDMDSRSYVEPNLPVQVTVTGMNEGSSYSILHIRNDGAVETVASDIRTSSYVFVADQFSVYIVVESGEDARLFVNFVKADGSTNTEIINQRQADTHLDQYIYDPGVGELSANEVFMGWTTEKNYDADTAAYTIEEVRTQVKEMVDAGVTDGDEVTYYAKVMKHYTVTYLDEKSITVKTDTVFFPRTDTSATQNYEVNLSYTPYVNTEGEEAGMSAQFLGWQLLDPEPEELVLYQNGQTVAISSNITLFAYVKNGYWLSFNENLKGATYTQPQFIIAGESPEKPADPTAAGYRFDGWYTEDASSERDGQVAGAEYDFSQPLEANTVVYGKWTMHATADYTVIIWKQTVDGSGYEVAETVTVANGVVGQTVNTVVQNGSNVNTGTTPAQTRNVRVNGTEKAYTGFHCDHMDSNVTIEANGTTVFNVYYNRNLITINFNANGRYILDENDGTYKQNVTYTGLYEAPLTFTWPTINYGNSQGTGTRYNNLWTYSGTTLTMIGAFKLPTNSDVTINLTRTNAGETPIYFYQMDGNGSYPTTPKDTIYAGNGTFTLTEKYTGFTLDQYRRNGTGSWQTATDQGRVTQGYSQLEIRYKRVQRDITYLDGVYVNGDGDPTDQESRGKLGESDLMYYGADTTSYNKGGANYYAPTYQGYVFLGWYADETCTKPYTFTTMQPDGITVYAKWVSREYQVNIHPNDSEDDPISYTDPSQATKFYVDFGEKVGNVGGERLMYDLVGWYSDSSFKTVYDFDVIVVNDQTIAKYGDPNFREEGWPSVVGKLDVYAKWRSKLDGANGINVVYDAGAGTGAPRDDNGYVDLAEAVAGAASTPNDTNMVFSHWVVQKWNESTSTFEDTNTHVFPAETFIVKKADAKEEAYTDPDDPSVDKKYTIQLRAEYIEKDKETLTFINWYDNYTGGKVATSKNIAINEATPIPAAPTRPGYTFKGWIRGYEEDGTTTKLTDLYIVYANGAYADAKGNPATEVAADENLVGEGGNKHHALYASWEANEVGYAVEFYYQNTDGTTYTKNEELGYTVPTAKTDSTANVTDADKNQTENGKYVLVEDDPSILTATVAADGSTVLKLYFDLNLVPVTVEHYLLGTTTAFKTDTIADQVVGSSYSATPETTYQEKKLTVNSYDPSQAITVKTSGNIIKIYYTLPLTITAKTDSKTYDGTPLTGEYTVEGALADDEAKIKNGLGDPASITDVGSVEYQAATTTVPGYYVVTNKKGTLTVNKRTVTLTSADGEKVYDGQPLVKNAQTDVTVTGDGFVTGEGATYDITGSQTLVGSSENKFTYTLNEGTKADNYDIKTVFGTLTVTDGTNPGEDPVDPKKVVTKDDGEEKADTKYHVGDTITWTIWVKNIYDAEKTLTVTENLKDVQLSEYPKTLTPGQEIEITATYVVKASDVEAGEIKNDVTVKLGDLEKPGDDEVKTEPIAIEITAASDEKKYDGTALTNSGYELTSEQKLIEGHEIDSVKVEGSQTLVGSSKNVASEAKIVDEAGEDVTAGYDIKYVDGTLTVTDGTKDDPVDPELVVTKDDGEDDESKKYHIGDTIEWTITATNIYDIEKTLTVTEKLEGVVVSGLPEGKVQPGDTVKIKAEYVVTAADVEKGSIKNEVEVQWEGTDKTYPGDDEVKTEPIAIEITAASDSKEYDGEPLTNSGYELTDGELAEGNKIESVKVEGEQTLVGTSANVASEAKIIDADGEDVTAGYKITYVDGKLEVTEPEDPTKVVVKEDKEDGKVYHVGDTIEWNIWVKNIYDEVKTLTVTEKMDGVVVGEYPAELQPNQEIFVPVTYVVKAEDIEKGELTNEVDIQLSDKTWPGDDTVEVEPIKIEITAASDKKVYDGTELTNSGYELTDGELAEGDKIDSVTVTGSQLLVGESANVASDAIILNTKGEDVTAGYEITYIDGTLTVTDGTNPDDEKEVEDDLVVTKTDDNEGTLYQIDDVITWTITATNIYEEAQTITLTEIEGVELEQSVFENVAGGETVTTTATYTVTEDDALAGSFTNTVTAKMGNITKTAEETAQMEQIFILTVHYRYTNGGWAAKDKVELHYAGDHYNVPSPIIKGYRCMTTYARGDMPKANKEITVYYVPVDTDIPIDDYGTPLGLDNASLNLGECIE